MVATDTTPDSALRSGSRGTRNQQTARAGEFYVAAELCRRGAYAVILTGNMPGVDILASDADGKRVVQIQVKTKRSGTWHTVKRTANLELDRHAPRFWVFVDLGQEGAPRYWVVPETAIVEMVKQGVAVWKQRNPNSRSTHCAIREKSLTHWKGAWSILEILP